MRGVWSRPRQHQPRSKHTLSHPSIPASHIPVTDATGWGYLVVSLKAVAHKESQSHNHSHFPRHTLRDGATPRGAKHLLTEPGEQVQQLPGKP